MTLLGKKTIWWRLKVVLFFPLWFKSMSPTRKTWDEFMYGLITHEHEYDYENPEWTEHAGLRGKQYPCKHYGCNTVSVMEPDGKWCEVIQIKK